jgi:hypothetical protein
VSEDSRDAREDVRRFVDELGVRACVVLDPDRTLHDRLGARRLPTTYVADPAGIVRKINHGTGPGYEARMERWLEQVASVVD